jgi:hypothetical protein
MPSCQRERCLRAPHGRRRCRSRNLGERAARPVIRLNLKRQRKPVCEISMRQWPAIPLSARSSEAG